MPVSDDEVIETYMGGSLIPPYQREFAWTGVLSANLFDSLHRFLLQNPQIAAVANRKRFYLGTMITVQGAPIPIVDGQQRMTSLCILGAVMRDYCIGREDYDIAHRLDRAFVWSLRMNGGRQRYQQGNPKVELRNTGNARYNLRENMRHICSLELTEAGDYEVVGVVLGPGGRDILTLDLPLNWTLAEGCTIQFNLAGPQTVRRPAAIATMNVQVDNGTVAIGDTFVLNYGVKNGTEPVDEANISEAESALRDTLRQTLDLMFPPGAVPAATNPAHLGTIEDYVGEFIELVEQTTVTQVLFPNPADAMQYFMTVNDSTLRANLTDLDRLRALVEIVKGSVLWNPGGGAVPAAPAGGWNAAIGNAFEYIEDTLLNNRNKDNKYQQEFFYVFGQIYLAERITRGEVITTIEPQLKMNWSNITGQWRKDLFLDFITEMKHFVAIYFRATDDWTATPPGVYTALSTVSNTVPYLPEDDFELDEEFFVHVARKFSVQWIPAYVSGIYVVRREHENGSITDAQYEILSRILLRTLLKMDLVGRVIAKHSGQNSFTGGNVYAFIDAFCGRLRALRRMTTASLTTAGGPGPAGGVFAAIETEFDEMKDQIDNEINGVAAFGLNPVLDNAIVYPPTNPLVDIKNSNCEPLLMLAEWDQGGFLLHPAAYDRAVVRFDKTQVEHIQPMAIPGGAGAYAGPVGGYTAPDEDTWKENRNRLGNRLLIKQFVNNHIGDSPLAFKIRAPPGPPDCSIRGCNGVDKHYWNEGRSLTAKWLLANGPGGWLSTVGAGPNPPTNWGTAEINIWEKFLLQRIVAILP
jgi:hypothetical protein